MALGNHRPLWKSTRVAGSLGGHGRFRRRQPVPAPAEELGRGLRAKTGIQDLQLIGRDQGGMGDAARQAERGEFLSQRHDVVRQPNRLQ